MNAERETANRDRFIELGLTIAALRKKQGLSQDELANSFIVLLRASNNLNSCCKSAVSY